MSAIVSSSQSKKFVEITPAGCFYAVQSTESNAYRDMLLDILRCQYNPVYPGELSEQDQQEQHVEGLHCRTPAFYQTLQEAGFIVAKTEMTHKPVENLDALLARSLGSLSDLEKVVLTDSGRGLFLGYSGFTSTQAEELAVVDSSIRIVYEKSEKLLREELSIDESAFGIIDPAGHSQLGFWSCFVGKNVFTFIVYGVPQFNRPEFRDIIQFLVQRYGHT